MPEATAGSVIPRMVVSDVAGAVAFLRDVFGASGEVTDGRPAEVDLQGTTVMVSEAGERDLFPAFLYVYVDDADAAFGRAMTADARCIEDPVDTFYGDRRAMVADPFGNVFQIAHRREGRS
ncbi:VOC family protein [Actinomycetospora endophytica]|uniref:VOC family protein n=1 Tax=Actinomycetospora endophytica TaxID=2291215 RepID=A0ABS8PGX1_9PSEU|nr:VOC family protein [Actinomycetospora endophytica]MCD2196646.1 VOC family protein [Actinomycetospora endophytica]